MEGKYKILQLVIWFMFSSESSENIINIYEQ